MGCTAVAMNEIFSGALSVKKYIIKWVSNRPEI